jgi:hypothetical protein
LKPLIAVPDIVDGIYDLSFLTDQGDRLVGTSESSVFKVVSDWVRSQRKDGSKDYKIYCSDVRFSSAFRGSYYTSLPKTVDYLRFKKVLEARLTRAYKRGMNI